MKLSVKQSWGCGTARYCSGLVAGSSLLDIPLNMCVERWDGKTGERLFCFQAHSQVITAMRHAPAGSWERPLIMTASNGGELKLWGEEWDLLSAYCVNVTTLRHVRTNM